VGDSDSEEVVEGIWEVEEMRWGAGEAAVVMDIRAHLLSIERHRSVELCLTFTTPFKALF
jgi:hypothetical protein